MLSEAVEGIGDGEIKDQLFAGVTALTETVREMESGRGEMMPEDEMAGIDDETDMNFGELEDMAPDMAGMTPEPKPGKKQRMGAMVEEENE